jgi:hypothetical protein
LIEQRGLVRSRREFEHCHVKSPTTSAGCLHGIWNGSYRNAIPHMAQKLAVTFFEQTSKSGTIVITARLRRANRRPNALTLSNGPAHPCRV